MDGPAAGPPPARAAAAILTIGSELTTGRIADTNAQWAADRLTALGFEVVRIITVDDDATAIGDAWRACRSCASLVWATGGLGPTADDLTVGALAAALGRGTAEDAATVERLRRNAARRGVPLPAAALRMARIPAGAEALDNPVGAAPGIWLEQGGTTLVILPGVPAEMKAIAEAGVLPRLGGRARPSAARVYRICGITEGAVDERVRGLWDGLRDGERFALQIARGEVLFRVRVAADGREAAAARLAELDRAVRERLGDALYGTDEETLEGRIVARLRETGTTVAAAESVTGGLVLARLASVPGASAALRGGWVAYQNEAKTEWLGLTPARLAADGAVSAETAAAMAAAARDRAGTVFAVSTTGWAGPDGGTAADPAGTVYLGLAGPGGVRAERRWFRGGRDTVRELAATASLDLLRRAVA